MKMKATASTIIAGSLALVVWGGLVSRDVLAQAEVGRSHDVQGLTLPQTPAVRPADQRAALNARLKGMLAEGRGGRLTETATSRANPRRRPVAWEAARGERDQSAHALSSRPRGVRSASYVAPKLDLTAPRVIPRDPVTCLTQTIYYEARSENERGQAAVAEVVMNRAASGRYPRDICEVVYQRNTRTCQFTFTCDGSIGRFPINPVAWARAERIAREVYTEGYQAILPKRSVNYHANYVRPRWADQLERVNRIGAHIFYGSPLGGFSTPGAERTTQPSSERGLVFVRNEEIERAYALLTGKTDRSGS